MTEIELHQWFIDNSEPELAAFNAKLIPDCKREILGIRVPKLRKLAKILSKEWPNIPPLGETQEEVLLRCFLLGEIKVPFSQLLALIVELLPRIDNWATCDGLCATLKVFNRYDREGYEFLLPFCSSDKVYEQRFAIVMLLVHYVRSAYIKRILEIFTHIKPKDYYVRMAVGWALSKCYIKYPENVEEALQHPRLDEEVRRMAIQKILESRHTDAIQKQRILRLRNQ